MPVYFLVAADRVPRFHEVLADGIEQADGGIWIQGHKIPARAWEMWMLASYLGGLPSVGRPVVDRTGYKGSYEFRLDFSNGDGDDRPEISRALQNQLGLRLEPGRATVEIIVIDHLERPAV
jgi:uncharacterized protein (TIGR03435 family)